VATPPYDIIKEKGDVFVYNSSGDGWKRHTETFEKCSCICGWLLILKSCLIATSALAIVWGNF